MPYAPLEIATNRAAEVTHTSIESLTLTEVGQKVAGVTAWSMTVPMTAKSDEDASIEAVFGSTGVLRLGIAIII